MRSMTAATLSVLLGGSAVASQKPPAPVEQTSLISLQTTLVSVDVVVIDKDGKPVRNLKREDFLLKENGKLQQIAVFARGTDSGQTGTLPPLPQDVYTNRPEYHPPRESLTIVLLDSLNTPQADQAFMLRQMVRYFASALQGKEWTAILALTSRLRVLQDFTTDRERLLTAVKNYNPQYSSPLGLREMVTSREQQQELEALWQEAKNCDCRGIYEYIGELQSFQLEAMAATDNERMARTLAAFRALANAVLGYPGRKNLIWVSASFPLIYRGPRYEWSAGDDLWETVRLLNAARLAIYPVDPRGLIDAMQSESYAQVVARMSDPGQGAGSINNPQSSISPGAPASASPTHPQYFLTSSQDAMKELAAKTGGEAFYDRNDISRAVAQARADGSTYYAVAYYPQDTKWDGRFRRIEVKVTRKGLHLRYRQGYYAVPATVPVGPSREVTTTGQIGEDLQAALYDPLPATGLTFRVHVPPPKPASNARVAVEFWLDKSSLRVGERSNSSAPLDLNFVVAAFSPEGKLVNSVARRVRWSQKVIDYFQALQNQVVLPTSIELPPGNYQLHLVLRDNHTGLLGRVDAPVVVPPREGSPMH